MKNNNEAIKKRLHTIISKLVDVQQLLPGDMNLQEAARKINYVIRKLP